MKYNKKVISFFMAVLMLIGMCSCGTKTTEEGDVPTLTWYNYGPQVRELDEVFEKVSDYTEEKIGCRVNCINIPGAEWAQKMGLILASNEEFDICFTSAGQSFHTNASKNSYMALDELLDNYGKDLKELLPDYAWKSATVKGSIYAVPAYKDNAYRYSLVYNTKYVDEIGFDVSSVKELKDIEPCLEKFKKKYPSLYPLRMNSRYTCFGELGFIDIAGGAGYSIYDKTGKVINYYDTPEAKAHFKLMYNWYKKGYIRPDVATATDDNGVDDCVISLTQMLPYQLMTENLTRDEDHQMGEIELCKPFLTGSDGSMVAISRTSKHPEKAMEFINLLNTDEYLRNLVAYGIEGRHYVKVDDKHYNWPEGVATRDDNSYFSYPFAQGNMFITYTMKGTPDDIWDKYKEFDASAVKSPLFGFTFDQSNVKTEISALNNIKNEFMIPLMCGAVDPDVYLPKALQKMKDAGIDTVIDEINKQIKEWKKQ